MPSPPRRPERSWWAGNGAATLLVAVVLVLAAGAVLHGVGAPGAGNLLWAGSGAAGAGYSLWMTLESLRHGRLGVDLIAVLALVGAVAVGEYLAAGVIAVMVASGRALESWAAGRAHRDLGALLARAPRFARRVGDDGLETIPVEDIRMGDRLVAGTGEMLPADGVLLTAAVLDESVLTGESLPAERGAGDPVRSGVVNAGAPVEMRATATAAASTYAGVIRLVADAGASQAPFVRLADRYALWFLGVSVAASGTAWALAGPARAVAVLVVATPCPLILAAPIALVAGLSQAARRGVIIKGGAVLERLARCTTVLIDKTGTLTGGHPTLSDVVTAGAVSAPELLTLAASLDQLSPHVLAHAVVASARGRGCELTVPEAVREVPGAGIEGIVAGRPVAVGKADWVGMAGSPPWARRARRRARLDGSSTVFVGVDDHPAGVLLFDDPVRPDAARTIRGLRVSGIDRVVMVTGDRIEVADAIGAVLGVDEVLADRSPEEKLDAVRIERRRAPTIMVGDGVNDAPALALADVGVAMGARGATASSEAADVVLAVDRLDRLGEARAIASRSRRIAIQSVAAGTAMSLAAMAVAAAGFLPAIWGAVLQEGIDVAVIVNALRALGEPEASVRLRTEDQDLTRRFQGEHRAVRAALEQMRSLADRLDQLEPAEAAVELRLLQRVLEEEVVPHEAAEQQILYPALDRLLGGADPTGPMSRAHVEIAHQIRQFRRLVDEIDPAGPDPEEVVELRRLLYGLDAVLRLHTAQEEESYFSLADHAELADLEKRVTS